MLRRNIRTTRIRRLLDRERAKERERQRVYHNNFPVNTELLTKWHARRKPSWPFLL